MVRLRKTDQWSYNVTKSIRIYSTEINSEKVTDTLEPLVLPDVSVGVDETQVVSDPANVETTPLLRLVRPIRDGTYRYDSYGNV